MQQQALHWCIGRTRILNIFLAWLKLIGKNKDLLNVMQDRLQLGKKITRFHFRSKLFLHSSLIAALISSDNQTTQQLGNRQLVLSCAGPS